MTWVFFLATAFVIVAAGARLARYSHVTGLGRVGSGWCCSLPRRAYRGSSPGFGSTALADLPMRAVVTMNALLLVGLTYRVIKQRFLVTWDTGAIAVVYAIAVVLVHVSRA